MLLTYIKYKYFYEIEFKIVPKYLPKIIKEDIDSFNDFSKSPTLKQFMINVSFKNMIIHFVILFLWVYLVFI